MSGIFAKFPKTNIPKPVLERRAAFDRTGVLQTKSATTKIEKPFIVPFLPSGTSSPSTPGVVVYPIRPAIALPGKVILYLHAGTYISGSIRSHGKFVSHIAEQSHRLIYFVEYSYVITFYSSCKLNLEMKSERRLENGKVGSASFFCVAAFSHIFDISLHFDIFYPFVVFPFSVPFRYLANEPLFCLPFVSPHLHSLTLIAVLTVSLPLHVILLLLPTVIDLHVIHGWEYDLSAVFSIWKKTNQKKKIALPRPSPSSHHHHHIIIILLPLFFLTAAPPLFI